MSDDRMDAQIKHAEMLIGGMTVSTNIAHLNKNITDLSVTVADLSKNVQKVSDDMNSSEGLRVEIRELKRRFDDLDTKWTKTENAVWPYITRIIIALSGIGLGTLFVVGRVGYNIFIGAPAK